MLCDGINETKPFLLTLIEYNVAGAYKDQVLDASSLLEKVYDLVIVEVLLGLVSIGVYDSLAGNSLIGLTYNCDQEIEK